MAGNENLAVLTPYPSLNGILAKEGRRDATLMDREELKEWGDATLMDREELKEWGDAALMDREELKEWGGCNFNGKGRIKGMGVMQLY